MESQFRFKPAATAIWHCVPLGPPTCTAKIASEPKKSFIYNKIMFYVRSQRTQGTQTGQSPNPDHQRTHRSIENKNSIGFVSSFFNPDRRPVHLLVRDRDAPLRPIAIPTDPILQTVDHEVPARIHTRLPSRKVKRAIADGCFRQV
jgi:hypothetical protein